MTASSILTIENSIGHPSLRGHNNHGEPRLPSQRRRAQQTATTTTTPQGAEAVQEFVLLLFFVIGVLTLRSLRQQRNLREALRGARESSDSCEDTKKTIELERLIEEDEPDLSILFNSPNLGPVFR